MRPPGQAAKNGRKPEGRGAPKTAGDPAAQSASAANAEKGKPGTRQGAGTMTYAATEDQDARVVQGMWEEGRLVVDADADADVTAEDTAPEDEATPEPPTEATGDGEQPPVE